MLQIELLQPLVFGRMLELLQVGLVGEDRLLSSPIACLCLVFDHANGQEPLRQRLELYGFLGL